MFKILQTSLFAVLVVLSYTATAIVLPKDVLKKGTKFVYDVNLNGTQYEFTVTLKDQSEDYTFEWSMGIPINKTGMISVTKEATKNASGLFNLFDEKDVKLTDQSCFMISQKMFETFSKRGSMEIVMDKKSNFKSVFGNAYNHTQTFGYKNNETQEFYCTTISSPEDYQITYLNDSNFPLIIEMNLGWTLKLKDIYY